MARKKKTPIYRYGIEITKPHSKEMYAHNDAIALEMKRNILSEIHLSYSQAMGDIAANGGSDAGEERLRKIVQAFTGYSFGDGYDLEDIKDEGINTLANIANWSLHAEYSYLCFESIVPRTKQMMVGFDWEKHDYSEIEDGPIKKVLHDDELNESFDSREDEPCPDGNGMQC